MAQTTCDTKYSRLYGEGISDHSCDVNDILVKSNHRQPSIVQAVKPDRNVVCLHMDIEAGKQYDKYIIVAAVVTVLWFWPIGLLAIYNAFQARLSARLGAKEEALIYRSWATTLIVWTVFTGFIIWVFIVLFYILKIQNLEI